MLNHAFRYRYLFNLLTCFNVFFLFYIYIVRWCVLQNRRQTEKKCHWGIEVEDVGCVLAMEAFSQNLSGIGTKCQNSLDLDQVEIFPTLIWIQTVCKGYQQMMEVGKAFHMSMKLLCIGSHYMLKLCFAVRPSEYDQKIHIHRLWTIVRISNNIIKCM